MIGIGNSSFSGLWRRTHDSRWTGNATTSSRVKIGWRISLVAPDLGFGYIVSLREHCQLIAEVGRMSAKSLIHAVAAVILVAACSPQPPQYFGPPQASLFSIPPEPLFSRVSPAAINSDAFAKRQPLPGQRGYLETIRFIDNGIKYIDPFGEFFISSDGEMCFRGLVNRQLLDVRELSNYWCMNPHAVNNVEELQNSITNVNRGAPVVHSGSPAMRSPDRLSQLSGREPLDRQQHLGGDPSRRKSNARRSSI